MRTVSIVDVVMYSIAVASTLIHEIKKGAVNANVVIPRPQILTDWLVRGTDPVANLKHLDPRHPEWRKYKGLKREVTLWILARRMLKAQDVGEMNEGQLLEFLRKSHKTATKADMQIARLRLDAIHNYMTNGIQHNKLVWKDNKIVQETTYTPKTFENIAIWAQVREDNFRERQAQKKEAEDMVEAAGAPAGE